MISRFSLQLQHHLQGLTSPLIVTNHEASPALQEASEHLKYLNETRDVRQITGHFEKIGDALLEAASHVESMDVGTRDRIKQFQTTGHRSAAKRQLLLNKEVIITTARKCIEAIELGMAHDLELRASEMLTQSVQDILTASVTASPGGTTDFATMCWELGSKALREAIAREYSSDNKCPHPLLEADRPLLPLADSALTECRSHPPKAKTSLPLIYASGLLPRDARDLSERGNKIAARHQEKAQADFTLPDQITWPKMPQSFMGLMKALRNNKASPVNDQWVDVVAQELSLSPEIVTQRLRKLFSITTEKNFPAQPKEKRPFLLSCRMLLALIEEVDKLPNKLPYCAEKQPTSYYSFPRSET